MFMPAEHKHSLKITLTTENAAGANITSLRPMIMCVRTSPAKLMTLFIFKGSGAGLFWNAHEINVS